MSKRRKTFFEIVAERGQTAVARDLDLDKAIVHRCFHLKQGVNEDLLAACVRVYGNDVFDFDRTLVDWGQGRLRAMNEGSGESPSQATEAV